MSQFDQSRAPRAAVRGGVADLSPVLRALGPWRIAHRVQLRDHGVSAQVLRSAIDGGYLRRIRRDWFAAPTCDARLVRAAHAGVTLGCVSAAAVHGMWDLEPQALHVSAARSTPRIDVSVPSTLDCRLPLRTHWTRHPEHVVAPRVRAPIQSVANTLVAIAQCQPLEQAVIVVDSALRRGLIELGEIGVLASTDAAMARVLAHADVASDSDSETLARVRLGRRGIVMVPQVIIDDHPVDGLIGTALVLQLDGFGPHSTRDQHNRDLRQDDRLRRKGYIVLRYSRDLVIREWPMIESTILGIVRAGRHLMGGRPLAS
jgi:very-short-patch-repair endonuclease